MRIGLCALAVFVPVSAAAAPGVLATVKSDVDADGIEDDIKLTPEGVVVVASGGHADATFALAADRATITAGGRWIAVAAETRGGIEGVGLEYKDRGLALVWRGPIGPVGVDADYRIELTATADGLIRHHSRRDVVRCDGRQALLFAEGWDPAKRAFRAVRQKPAVDASAATLRATPVADGPPRPVVFSARAASTSAGATDAGALSVPTELDDGDVATAWTEDRGGDGRGEFVTYRAIVRGQSARALYLAPGGDATTNRPTRLAVVGAERAYWIEIPQAGAAFRIDLPEPIADCVSVVIGEVKRGKGAPVGGGKTSIGELVVLGDADLAPGGADAALAAVVVAGGTGASGAAQMLVRRGASGATAVVTALAATGLARDARGRLLGVLIRSREPAGAATLATAIATELAGSELADATRALAAMGTAAVSPLAALAGDGARSIETRVAALDALAEIPGPEATAGLTGVAGNGPRGVRVAVTHALGKRPIAELVAATAPAALAAQADLLRGIGLAGLHASDADRARGLAVLITALAAARDYEGRYRSIQGVAALGDDPALRQLDRALVDLPSSSASTGLHQVAALALARNPEPEATAILVRLARHADPGVRRTAIGALADRDPTAGSAVAPGAGSADAIDRVLIGVLAGDHWPELRRSAAGSLGKRCRRPGPAKALAAAVDGDAELEVRADALVGLVECRAAGIADRLIELALDAKAPLPLRERAVILTVALGDKRLERPLIELFERFRSAAYDSPEALVLASRAAVALGRLGGAKAAAALEAALGDEALPELLSAVAAGLGALGPACPRTAAATLRELARSDQQMVATSARRAAAQCRK